MTNTVDQFYTICSSKHTLLTLSISVSHTCRIEFISISWHLLVANMREERSAPLDNLSTVNYGNLPSRLGAFAAGLPFVSKSKSGICNIGTLLFSYKGMCCTNGWRRVTFTARQRLGVALRNKDRKCIHIKILVHAASAEKTHQVRAQQLSGVCINERM